MNLYVHFPFCRVKCSYCALLSRGGASESVRAAAVARVVREWTERDAAPLETVYFGGGTPALCDLSPWAGPLAAWLSPGAEFTVELHPGDVTAAKLDELVQLGVNRISMGVQSFDDAVLAEMGRGHTAAMAEVAFRQAKAVFPNAGLDLIAGWPGVSDDAWRTTVARALALKPVHVSCYTLIREPKTRLDWAVRQGRVVLPDDAAAMLEDQLGPITVDVIPNVKSMSFANGLPYVPFDGYVATLHKGERVVPANQNKNYNFTNNNYFDHTQMNNGTDVNGVAAAIAEHNRRTLAGFGG